MAHATRDGVPAPFAPALAHYGTVHTPRLPVRPHPGTARLLRGAHTYHRTDIFPTRWDTERSEEPKL
jgi:hypothetical protein